MVVPAADLVRVPGRAGALVQATGPAQVELTASAAATSLAAAAGTVTPLAADLAVPGGTTDPAHAPAAVGERPAWAREAEEALEVAAGAAAVVDAAGSGCLLNGVMGALR